MGRQTVEGQAVAQAEFGQALQHLAIIGEKQRLAYRPLRQIADKPVHSTPPNCCDAVSSNFRPALSAQAASRPRQRISRQTDNA